MKVLRSGATAKKSGMLVKRTLSEPFPFGLGMGIPRKIDESLARQKFRFQLNLKSGRG